MNTVLAILASLMALYAIVLFVWVMAMYSKITRAINLGCMDEVHEMLEDFEFTLEHFWPIHWWRIWRKDYHSAHRSTEE